MTTRGPWYITQRAAEEYRELRGWPDDDEHFDRAEDDLLELARQAHHVRTQDNGLELYRGPSPGRLRLLVSTAQRVEGELPQLVQVLAQSDRAVGSDTSAEPHVLLQLPRVPRSQMGRWRDAAERAGKTLSQWALEALDRAAKR